jgi:hypothetical protein
MYGFTSIVTLGFGLGGSTSQSQDAPPAKLANKFSSKTSKAHRHCVRHGEPSVLFTVRPSSAGGLQLGVERANSTSLAITHAPGIAS